jgi:hypothetical protein
MGGLMWFVWAMIKAKHGVDFGDYGLHMLQYSKEYTKITNKLLENTEAESNA